MAAESRTRRATIRDVAAEAHVSIATVSLYMQGKAGVAAETSQRIAAAVERLSYVPRSRAGNGRRSALFVLLMEELSLAAFPEAVYGAIIRSLEAQARQQNLGMLLATVEDGRLPQSIVENQAQGAIILGGCPTNDALAGELAARGIPLVLVDTYLFDLSVSSVVPDNEWGGYMAYKHLVELGHRRIALIEGPPKYKTLVDRRWGALRAAEELGVPLHPEYRQPSISSGFPKKGYREMKKLLALAEPPSAVFAVSDRAALGALEAIKEAGLRVPDDISLVGFDDGVDAQHSAPPLTTVHFAREQMGVLAMETLLAQIEGKVERPIRMCIHTELMVRASTAPPHGANGSNGGHV